MTYASASNVVGYCKSLLGSASTFDSTTSPASSHVEGWLAAGYSRINAYLSGSGYTIPVASTASIYNELVDLNALYAAARAEMSRVGIVINAGERLRGKIFMDMFYEGINSLGQMDLTAMGVTRSSTMVPYAGGISISDKDTYESNTDRVKPRFYRGMHDFPGTLANAHADDDDDYDDW
ncbi:MAG: hypothetical protein WCY09_08665 [Candidatus Omnitrophota bacterium]